MSKKRCSYLIENQTTTMKGFFLLTGFGAKTLGFNSIGQPFLSASFGVQVPLMDIAVISAVLFFR